VTLPPLPITITAAAPLVAGPPPVRPPLLSHPPVPRDARAIPPATGRVEGLATVAPRIEEPPAPPVVVVAPEPVRQLVHRKVRSGPPVERAAMVEAVGGYVGEPREPAVPHRAPGWMRYVPEWLSQSTPDPDPVPSAPEPANKPDFLRPPPEPKKKVVEAVRQDAVDTVDTERPAQPKRRPTLGQTRRLGLGAPLRHRPEEQAEPPAEVPEPAPTPPAPVAEVAESPEETDDEPEAEPPPPRPEPPPLLHPRPAEAVTPPQPEPPPPPAATPAPPIHRPRAAAVPTDLASALRGPHSVDVSAIPVHRGPTVSAEARSLGARAFTRGGEVFLPDEAGPIDAPKARGLLAHELVHAVQQRTLGHALPSSSTVAGAQLEAEAVAAEHQHSGHSAPSMVHPSVPRMLTQAAQAAGVQLAPLIPDSIPAVVPAQVAQAAAPAVTEAASTVHTLTAPARQEVDTIAQESAGKVIEQWTNPALGGTGFGVPGTAAAGRTPPNLIPGGIPGRLPGGQNADAIANLLRQLGGAAGLPTGPQLPGAGQGSPLSTAAGLVGGALSGGGIDSLISAAPGLISQELRGALSSAGGIGPELSAAVGVAGSLLGIDSPPAVPPQPSPVSEAGVARQDATQPRTDPVVPEPKARASAEKDESEEDENVDLSKIDMEELSARLYDRLRSRLRLELLIDRERAGLLTDFR
jgi:hypothetical protein